MLAPSAVQPSRCFYESIGSDYGELRRRETGRRDTRTEGAQFHPPKFARSRRHDGLVPAWSWELWAQPSPRFALTRSGSVGTRYPYM